MLLNRFCDAQGWLWVGNQRTGKVYKQRPRKAFVRRHIYTSRPYHNDGTPDFEYEQALSGLEHNAASVIDKVVSSARRLERPKLFSEEQADLQRFVLALARRTPESQRRVSRGLSLDDYYDIFRYRAEKAGFRWSLDRGPFHANTDIREHIERLQHNVDAAFAAGDDPRLVAEESKFIAETGLQFVVIHRSKNSFVLGSHGITICNHGSISPYLTGTVLPLADDVLVHVTQRPTQAGLLILEENMASAELIKAVNRATVAQSETVAGRSENLIRSLLQQQNHQ